MIENRPNIHTSTTSQEAGARRVPTIAETVDFLSSENSPIFFCKKIVFGERMGDSPDSLNLKGVVIRLDQEIVPDQFTSEEDSAYGLAIFKTGEIFLFTTPKDRENSQAKEMYNKLLSTPGVPYVHKGYTLGKSVLLSLDIKLDNKNQEDATQLEDIVDQVVSKVSEKQQLTESQIQIRKESAQRIAAKFAELKR